MQATVTATPRSFGQRLRWNDLILPWLIRLAFLGLGLLIGLYALAPRQVRASDTYVPPAYSELQNAVVTVSTADGAVSTLPIKFADTTAARNTGFTDVGVKAMDNQILLYQLTRESTARTTYATGGFRTPVQVAVANGQGEIIAIHDVAVGTERFAVAENHRWLLAARHGTFDALGIGVGASIDPEAIVKVNY